MNRAIGESRYLEWFRLGYANFVKDAKFVKWPGGSKIIVLVQFVTEQLVLSVTLVYVKASGKVCLRKFVVGMEIGKSRNYE